MKIQDSTSNSNTRMRVGAAVASLLLVSVLVIGVSAAAFTASTDASANWDAGTVSLSHVNEGNAALSVGNIKPGDSGTHCIDVSYDGTIEPQPVTFSVSDLQQTDGASDGAVLAGYLDVTVEMHVAGDTCASLTSVEKSTSDTLLALSTASAWTTWQPSVSGSDTVRAFVFSWVFRDEVDQDDAQGDDATATFTWETTS